MGCAVGVRKFDGDGGSGECFTTVAPSAITVQMDSSKFEASDGAEDGEEDKDEDGDGRALVIARSAMAPRRGGSRSTVDTWSRVARSEVGLQAASQERDAEYAWATAESPTRPSCVDAHRRRITTTSTLVLVLVLQLPSPLFLSRKLSATAALVVANSSAHRRA